MSIKGSILRIIFLTATPEADERAWLPSSRRAGAVRGEGLVHIPTDLVVAQESSDVESGSRLDCLLLHNLRRRFIA